MHDTSIYAHFLSYFATSVYGMYIVQSIVFLQMLWTVEWCQTLYCFFLVDEVKLFTPFSVPRESILNPASKIQFFIKVDVIVLKKKGKKSLPAGQWFYTSIYTLLQ